MILERMMLQAAMILGMGEMVMEGAANHPHHLIQMIGIKGIRAERSQRRISPRAVLALPMVMMVRMTRTRRMKTMMKNFDAEWSSFWVVFWSEKWWQAQSQGSWYYQGPCSSFGRNPMNPSMFESPSQSCLRRLRILMPTGRLSHLWKANLRVAAVVSMTTKMISRGH